MKSKIWPQWPRKWPLDDLLTSMTSEVAQWFFSKIPPSTLWADLLKNHGKIFIDFKNYPWERIVKKSDLKDGNTYLHLAAKYRQTEMFEKKIKGEIQKNPRNSLSMTPLHIACEKRHVSIAESIIKSSIENNRQVIIMPAPEVKSK